MVDTGHRIYPYLLRDLAIVRPNQVWSADITYVPMAQGFMYLFAIIDSVQSLCAGLAAFQHADGRSVSRRWIAHGPGATHSI